MIIIKALPPPYELRSNVCSASVQRKFRLCLTSVQALFNVNSCLWNWFKRYLGSVQAPAQTISPMFNAYYIRIRLSMLNQEE